MGDYFRQLFGTQVRLLTVLRNPIDLLFSSTNPRHHVLNASQHEEVVNEILEISRTLSGFGLADAVDNSSSSFIRYFVELSSANGTEWLQAAVARSRNARPWFGNLCYGSILSPWFHLFARNLHVVIAESLFTNQRAVMTDVFKFLGVADHQHRGSVAAGRRRHNGL